ncbi:DUF305 domain-containing protein [Erythrobacteraceae bacterium CFH 75059]|uniref:DUF305 domain-containing protein n=1 Tax=Qipengyuania thermophila TaxID=2509361 RepID=UPI0010206110|nr:DUF305 domain-containing protein [Qipengyuania thermophila]TCD06800.1 DUF305 domain-containing protein [Erythrobacteraceae bacterium CFH 75059]
MTPFTPVPRLLLSTALVAVAAPLLAAQPATVVQPGVPGAPPRVISAQEAARLADTRYTAADAAFMRDMIAHHAQALRLADMVSARTSNPVIVDTARRIRISQDDEIAFMRGWLSERGEPLDAEAAPAANGHGGHGQHGHTHHGAHAHHAMPGMLTEAQFAQLAAQRGAAFDRLFLSLMIEHHRGAITMVESLLAQPGSAHDPALFDFTTEVVNDQRAEIDRMAAQLAAMSDDPRVGLAPGFRDAGQAARNMTLVHSLPKPDGFFDPANPASLQPRLAGPAADAAAAEGEGAPAARTPPRFASRTPLLSFANTDLAFAGDLMAVGNYHGFKLYRLSGDAAPRLVSAVVCPGGQGDVSIVGTLLLMSVEQTRGRVDCGSQGIAEDVSAERFRGLRIFDIADPARPRQVGQVQTCRGSHTHSVVTLPTAEQPSIIVYNSGTAGVRAEAELAGCVGGVAGDPRTALFSIDVIEIPVADPAAARIIDSPRVFADEQGNIAGLWRGGDHGPGTQTTRATDQCHDITVFPSRRIAAGACSGNGILLDISDPRAPRRMDAVVDTGFAYWHSATFNNDGTKVLFTDEWGGGTQPRCRASDPLDWGANAIFDIVDGTLQRRATFKMPAPQTDKENCVAHNGSLVPVPGRDLMIQAWYQGGLSLFDFTDSTAPVEIGFFDRGPVDAEQMPVAGFWSAYFHRGHIYATEIVRGLDVLRLEPSEHLSANEIAAAALAEGEGAFNPQRQTPVTWPDVPVVALAYVDQLERSRALDAGLVRSLRASLAGAQRALDGGQQDRAAATTLRQAAARVRAARTGNAPDAARAAALGSTLEGIARKLG